jgi:hypothetical protein
MYLPFETSFAMFVGGLFRAVTDRLAERRAVSPEERSRLEGVGTLVASGFVAGEALLGVLLALLTLGAVNGLLPAPSIAELLFGTADLGIAGPFGGWLSLLVFAAVAWGLIRVPLRSIRS